jgi:hypothetical protein
MLKSNSITDVAIPRSYFDVERNRANDFMYSFLFDVTSRVNIFSNVLDIVQRTLHKENYQLSKRLTYILNKLKSFPDAVVQHGFVFYAICHNIDVKNFIICHYEAGLKRNTMETFINTYVEDKTNDLLNGKFRSFTEYVEDLRYKIIIELGV